MTQTNSAAPAMAERESYQSRVDAWLEAARDAVLDLRDAVIKSVDHVLLAAPDAVTPAPAGGGTEGLRARIETERKAWINNGLVTDKARVLGEVLMWMDEGPATRTPAGAAVDPVGEERPDGAIHNGRESLRRLAEHYDFQCEAGPLLTCAEYLDAVLCFEAMAEALATRPASQAPATSARRAVSEFQQRYAERLHQRATNCGWSALMLGGDAHSPGTQFYWLNLAGIASQEFKALAPTAQAQPAGRGEPVAWACEVVTLSGDAWKPWLLREKPRASSIVRNIRPLTTSMAAGPCRVQHAFDPAAQSLSSLGLRLPHRPQHAQDGFRIDVGYRHGPEARRVNLQRLPPLPLVDRAAPGSFLRAHVGVSHGPEGHRRSDRFRRFWLGATGLDRVHPTSHEGSGFGSELAGACQADASERAKAHLAAAPSGSVEQHPPL